MKMRKSHKGFSLIEIIIFIVIMAIIAVVILSTYTRSLKGVYIEHPQTIAIKAATTCMEYFLGQRYLNGYSAISPCPSSVVPIFCTSNMPSGYNVSTTCEADLNDVNYKIITVTVSGQGNAALSLLFANY